MVNHVTCRFAAACIATIAVTHVGYRGQAIGQAGGPSSGTSQAATKPVAAHADPVWHYEGSTGPAHWASLSPKFKACGDGRSQSPIDIAAPTRGATTPLKTEFPPAELRIAHNAHVADGINNGHTIQINYTGEARLTLGDVSYKLVQYHFHSPSEHTVDGKHFPMEMHMVSKSSDGRLAVVGVFIATGRHNRNFDPVWANLPAKKGMETHVPAVKVDVNALVPTVRTAYRYDGSLTTPPCSEGVKWIVMTTPIEMSSEQIGAFTRLIKDNNRPVQPLNGRTVLTDAVKLSPARK